MMRVPSTVIWTAVSITAEQTHENFMKHLCPWSLEYVMEFLVLLDVASPKPPPFHSFTSGWPVFPAPLVNDIVFSTLYILASFVKDKLSIGAWVYLWTFYFVLLIYIFLFVPVPYCFDDCGFVVEPEVRQVDSSSSILLSQDCSGYSRFFVFPYKLWNYLF